jgi:hypothetical protein
MYLNSENLVRALSVSDQLLKLLTIGDPSAGKPVISIEQLQDIVQEATGVSIEKYEVAFEATYLKGRIERYDGGKKAIIHIRANQTLDWKRFVTAKELIHILLDGSEHFSPYGDKTLDELIRKGHFGLASLGPPGIGPAQSEIVAEIAALEVLYPRNLREPDVNALAAGEITRVQIAHRYGIPPNYAATAIDLEYLHALLAHLKEFTK